jgi:hypothetical protein
MVKYPAALFFTIVEYLVELETRCKVAGSNADEVTSEQECKDDAETIEFIGNICESIGLLLSYDYAQRLVEKRKANAPLTNGARAMECHVLMERIEDESNRLVLMRIPAERASRYDQPELFGKAVADAFPSVEFDVWEAGNCFATARFTASVFHLMRVLEIGLTAFAGIFKVPAAHTNWQNIIEQIEKHIRGMPSDPSKAPDWKAKQEFYSQVAHGFMFLKDAWRNYTAHARGKYVEEQADTILINVRAFMQRLADGGIKE